MISSIVVSAAEQAEEHHMEIPMAAEAYGLLAFAGLVGLLLLTMAFRSVGTRH